MPKIKKYQRILLPSLLVFALAITTLLSIRPFGAFETRRKAADIPISNPITGSRLFLTGPAQVHVGDKFSVDLVLNTTNDPYYTVSRVDAIVNLNQSGIIPIPVNTTPSPVATRSGVLGLMAQAPDSPGCPMMPTFSDSCGGFQPGSNGCPWVKASDGTSCSSRNDGVPGTCQNGTCTFGIPTIVATPSATPIYHTICRINNPQPTVNCRLGEPCAQPASDSEANACIRVEGLGLNECNTVADCLNKPTITPKACIPEGQTGDGITSDISCCAGLKSISTASPPTCLAATNGTFICTKCGDGLCGLGENYCNCSNDCPSPISPPITPTLTPPSCSRVNENCNFVLGKNCCPGLACGEFGLFSGIGTCQGTSTISPTLTPTIIYTGGISLSGISAGKIFDSYPAIGGSGGVGYLLPSMRNRGTGVRNVLGTQSDSVTPTATPIPISTSPIPISGMPTPVLSPPPYPSNTYSISGVKNYAVNPDGTFRGFSGKDVFATLNFVAYQVGKVEVKLVYKDPSARDDTNIFAYLTTKPANGQEPQERLLSPPESFVVEVLPPAPTTTPIDCKTGVNTFSVSDPCENNVFRHATYRCYDGSGGVMGTDTSCKSSDTWHQEALVLCKGHSSCDITSTPTSTPSTRSSLSCTPSTGTYVPEDIINVDLVLNTRPYQFFGDTPVYGGEVEIAYDNGKLEPLQDTVTPITNVTNWTAPLTNIIDKGGGRITLDYGKNQPAFMGNTSIGRVALQVKQPGLLQFVFKFFQQYDNTSIDVSKVWGSSDGVNRINNLADVTNCIYTANQSGGLTPTPTPKIISRSSMIAYSELVSSNNYEIFIRNEDGSFVKSLTQNPGLNYEPNFSKDGNKIVFSSNRFGTSDIFIMNNDGTGLTRLTSQAKENYNPSFSPDGEFIIFVSSRDKSSGTDLYLMNKNGGGLRRTTNTNDSLSYQSPSFSPDGKKILFSDGLEIYTVNIDGTNLTKLTNRGTQFFDERPSFSPDGTKIVFNSTRRNNQFADIYIMNADGTNIKPLISESARRVSPSYSYDSTKILYYAKPNPNSYDELFYYDLNTSKIVQLTNDTFQKETSFGTSWVEKASPIPLKPMDSPVLSCGNYDPASNSNNVEITWSSPQDVGENNGVNYLLQVWDNQNQWYVNGWAGGKNFTRRIPNGLTTNAKIAWTNDFTFQNISEFSATSQKICNALTPTPTPPPNSASSILKLQLANPGQTIKVGDVFDINLLINTSGQKSLGADAVLNLDSSKMIVDSNQVRSGNFFDVLQSHHIYNYITNQQDANKLLVSAWQSTVLIPKSSSTDSLFATITVKAQAEGVGTMTFDCTSGSTDSNIWGMNQNDIIKCPLEPLTINIVNPSTQSLTPTPTSPIFPLSYPSPSPTPFAITTIAQIPTISPTNITTTSFAQLIAPTSTNLNPTTYIFPTTAPTSVENIVFNREVTTPTAQPVLNQVQTSGGFFITLLRNLLGIFFRN